MDLSIIIVSYNTCDLIGACLSSVIAFDGMDKEIFVVDNASIDGSGAYIQEHFPSVHLVINQENRGFGAANNQVLPHSRGRYIFFINPDTDVMLGTFGKAVSYMDANPHIGLAGTKIINQNGTLQESVSYRYPGQRHTRGELSGLKGQIACVQGSSMIARAEIMRTLGGFDEDFFLYGEDQDLCLRIRKAGYGIGYIEDAVLIHLKGQSERQTPLSEVWKKKIRAEYLFYRKHYLPETVARITREHLLKARWRRATIKLTLPFVRNKARAKEKLIKYKITDYEIRHPEK